MKKWYVIQTKPLCEDAVAKQLHNADFEVFNPKVKSLVKGACCDVVRNKSLFPSYLFSMLNLEDSNILHMIKYTRGVRKVLGAGFLPIPVPEEVVEFIKNKIEEKPFVEQQYIFKQGDGVRVKNGIFKDIEGILEKSVTAAGRVKVLLRMMNRLARIELSCGCLERV